MIKAVLFIFFYLLIGFVIGVTMYVKENMAPGLIVLSWPVFILFLLIGFVFDTCNDLAMCIGNKLKKKEEEKSEPNM